MSIWNVLIYSWDMERYNWVQLVLVYEDKCRVLHYMKER